MTIAEAEVEAAGLATRQAYENLQLDVDQQNSIILDLKEQLRMVEKDLEMLAEQIEISIKGDQNKYDSINDQRLKLNQRKILFIVNYAMSNASNPVSAFISV